MYYPIKFDIKNEKKSDETYSTRLLQVIHEYYTMRPYLRIKTE
jgi:hypothetical protein